MTKKPSAGRVTRATAGKCLCGGITFTFSAEPNWPHYCCCDDCQKWSGAPAVAWVDFPQSSFGLGDPEKLLRKHKSGGLAHRAFCSRCGSSLFAIDDDGPGFDETERHSAFDPFFRGKSSARTGTTLGLGLSLVKRIAMAHGGDAWIEPREGGTTVACSVRRT